MGWETLTVAQRLDSLAGIFSTNIALTVFCYLMFALSCFACVRAVFTPELLTTRHRVRDLIAASLLAVVMQALAVTPFLFQPVHG